MARIAVHGAGAIGASVAYHLALLGARDVVLADRGEIAGGSTRKAMGGVRQQFSTAPEVRLAQESIGFFEELGGELFQQVGYLFFATTEAGLSTLRDRRLLQASLGVPVEEVDAAAAAELAPGLATNDVLGGVFCAADGVAEPPAVTLELVRRAARLGVEIRERTPGEDVAADVRVLASGPWSAEAARLYGVDLPVRPLIRQLVDTTPVAGISATLPMVLEVETGFHFRRRGDVFRLAMVDPAPRWGFAEHVDESLLPDRLARLARRYPAAAGAEVGRAWAGLYDMTPDAHPIIGWVGDGLYAACGFSGHGFMQSPAVGRAVAEELLEGGSALDLAPYRVERFSGDAVFPEEVVL
ncbi:MAG TPA: FAD-binding oxidoreductase [Gaiellaceae bacterium]|nr:FAD-binding oxidoreductase [Gaiellaceae bacterium]